MTKGKHERLKEVYAHVRAHCGIHTQSDFASALNMTRPAISAAMNGNEAYLTDNLFKRICAAFQGVFNLDYLLTGEGTLLADKVKVEDMQKEDTKNYADELIASLRHQLADKERIIRLLEQKIEILEEMQHLDRNPLKDYPFPLGTADDTKPRPSISKK